VIDQNTSKIAIGMIRSVKPTQGGQLRVGIEVLSNKPVWVQLRALKNSQLFTNSAIKIEELKDVHNINISATVDIGNFSGIYLPIEEGLSEKETLILPKMNFIANNNYLLTVYGAEKYVFLANPIEARDDWLKVEVKI
jgi:hypothetical protein